MMRLSILFILCSFLNIKGSAQSYITYEYVKNLPAIEANKLIGNWTSNDSLQTHIRFYDSGHSVYLNNAGPYQYAFSKDSSRQINAHGYFPLWPPADCYLSLSEDILTVTTARVGGPAVTSYYRKSEH